MRNELDDPIQASFVDDERNGNRDGLIGDAVTRRLKVLRPGGWAGFPHSPAWYAVGDGTRIVALFACRHDAEGFAHTATQ